MDYAIHRTLLIQIQEGQSAPRSTLFNGTCFAHEDFPVQVHIVRPLHLIRLVGDSLESLNLLKELLERNPLLFLTSPSTTLVAVAVRTSPNGEVLALD